MKEISFPMRINKYLAHKGYATRREADGLIEKGLVFINGKKAELGEQVQKNDKVSVKTSQKEYLYFAYNKPKGIVTHSPKEKEADILKSLGRNDVFPVGRLDKDSEGLIILTNDGRVTKPLLDPNRNCEKEYLVGVDKEIKNTHLRKLEGGVAIEGYRTKPCKTKKLSSRKLSITLTEGKKHQVRRMLAAIGYRTESLKRIRVVNINLRDLKKNQIRKFTPKEQKGFLEQLGI